MLVLSRKANQRIIIDDNIELVVVAVSSDRVKLGFNAPSEVTIHREEVHRRIQSEDDAAAADRKLIGDDRRTPCDEHLTGELPTVAALVGAETVLAELRQAKDT